MSQCRPQLALLFEKNSLLSPAFTRSLCEVAKFKLLCVKEQSDFRVLSSYLLERALPLSPFPFASFTCINRI